MLRTLAACRERPHTSRSPLIRAGHRIGDFARDQSGSISVEMVLWLPVIFGLLMIITDVSLAFFGRAQAFRLIQDVNRAVSVGEFKSATNEETARQAKLALLAGFRSTSPNAKAQVKVEGGVVSTAMMIPASDLMLFTDSFLSSFADIEMTVGAQHYVEWPNS